MPTLSTPGGYNLLDAVSALIKSIRYEKEDEALYWAWEFIGNYEGYLWKRLLIFACQDVGLEDPQAIVVVNNLMKSYYQLEDSQKAPAEFMVIQAVLYLCRAPKSTEIDTTRTRVIEERLMGKRLDIPDYARDVHTESTEPGVGENEYYKNLLDDEDTDLGYVYGKAGKPKGYIEPLPEYEREEIREELGIDG